MTRLTDQELEWMAGKPSSLSKNTKRIWLSPFFLRKPYSGTSAEPQDDTQERLHEYDYLK